MKQSFSILLNGAERKFEAEPDKPLLWVLRDELGIKSARYSCGIGICAACLVEVDGRQVASCITPISAAAGRTVTTLEGLKSPAAKAVKAAWIAEDVPQCGYCQSGQIAAATKLLSQNPAPSDADIDQAMSRVLCRCGSYGAIRRAIKRAAAEL